MIFFTTRNKNRISYRASANDPERLLRQDECRCWVIKQSPKSRAVGLRLKKGRRIQEEINKKYVLYICQISIY